MQFCDYHGCPNKAAILSFHKVFTNDDGQSKWDVSVNCCDEHFDDLIMNTSGDKDFIPKS